MIGGKEEIFNKVKPLFELMGKNITLVGGNGDGQTTKVANQIIVALNIQAVAEALLFASKAGADPAKVRQALMGGFASSRILEVHGERMINRTFNPGFRINLHQKDLNLALQGAKALGISPAEYGNCTGIDECLRCQRSPPEWTIPHCAVQWKSCQLTKLPKHKSDISVLTGEGTAFTGLIYPRPSNRMRNGVA